MPDLDRHEQAAAELADPTECPRCHQRRAVFGWGCSACGNYDACVTCARADHHRHQHARAGG